MIVIPLLFGIGLRIGKHFQQDRCRGCFVQQIIKGGQKGHGIRDTQIGESLEIRPNLLPTRHEKPSRNAACLPPCPVRARHGKWPRRRCSTPRCGGWNVYVRSITHSYHKKTQIAYKQEIQAVGHCRITHRSRHGTLNAVHSPGCTALPHLRAGGTIPPDARPNCWPNGALHGVAMPPTRRTAYISEYPVSGEANRAQLSCHNCAYTPERQSLRPEKQTEEISRRSLHNRGQRTKQIRRKAVRRNMPVHQRRRTPQELFQTFRHDMPAYGNHQVRAQRLQVFLTGCI